jgi:hypothetical protein
MNPLALEVAQKLVEHRGHGDDARPRALAAARALIDTPSASWEFLWPVIVADEAFGRELFVGSLQDLSARGFGLGGKLDEEAIAQLYGWLYRVFPDKPEAEKSDRGWVMSGESDMIFVRSTLLQALVQRGSEAACRAIEGIAARNPEQEWWPTVLEQAQRFTRQATWRGVTPETLRNLASGTDRRLVNDEAELMQVVETALARIQQVLIGERPMAQHLWNVVKEVHSNTTIRTPKDENTFSDFVASLLSLDLGGRGIVVNREVEIQRGQETDIYVNPITNTKAEGEFASVTVTIEVKGCWHRELKSAMKDPLVDRYLRDKRCSHGIYLVGWFYCTAWSDEARKQDCPKSRDDLLEVLIAQAAELSSGTLTVHCSILDVRWPLELSAREQQELPALTEGDGS